MSYKRDDAVWISSVGAKLAARISNESRQGKGLRAAIAGLGKKWLFHFAIVNARLHR
jgi:hypothetical protein